MEKKKNNAVEKAEEATVKKSEKKTSNKNAKKSKPKQSTAKKAEERKKLLEQKKQKRLELIRERKEQKEKLKAERERAQAEKRVELARIKAHKKAEKEKAKATALREKNRRKAEYKARKQQIKAEKEQRRELLKKESKSEREARIKEEKRQRMEAKERRAEQKRQERESKRKHRQKNKDRNKGLGGWIAAVISLGVATLVLSSVLTFTFLMPTETDTMLDSAYKKSYLSTVEQVQNMDLNLSKILATDDTSAMQKYLVDTAINSELAENDLQQLPLQDESKFYTTKLVNQIGDFAKYLNNKIINGEELTESDYEGINRLYRANRVLKDALDETTSKMGEDYSFASLLEGGNGDLIISNFNQLQNLSVEYPELIYDGPFSDGQTKREIKGLSGEEIDKDKAVEIFNKVFINYNLEDVTFAGEVTSGNLQAYNVQGLVNGDVLYAQISKKGGKLIMFAYAGSCEEVNCDGQEAVSVAKEFLDSANLNDMEAVWINLANNVYTINFAYEKDGVIIYSDLVKVRVCAETKKVIGIEAKNYYTNHTERVINKATLTEAAAKEKVSSNIEVENSRLVIVPIGLNSEKLCYEFHGTFDGSTYYVYIDASTGRQVEMFKVVDGTEGELLM